ncbi:hypothetical protein CENSYa_0533 [Cenarchaeum symbiosum A]|uniref:Uncharacterized protein n=1 Tax=Cenarchaeum symbiosum (strain A) TaxID=414004 RepID=A0RUZ9_CENSY|nr:hypothetical protein CENSYa_0533 [Cenarchaeum symbiosum A]
MYAAWCVQGLLWLTRPVHGQDVRLPYCGHGASYGGRTVRRGMRSTAYLPALPPACPACPLRGQSPAAGSCACSAGHCILTHRIRCKATCRTWLCEKWDPVLLYYFN